MMIEQSVKKYSLKYLQNVQKSVTYCLIVLLFLHGSYHGLHTESMVTAGAAGDT